MKEIRGAAKKVSAPLTQLPWMNVPLILRKWRHWQRLVMIELKIGHTFNWLPRNASCSIYRGFEKVSPPVRQSPLKRRLVAPFFERAILSQQIVAPLVSQLHFAAKAKFEQETLGRRLADATSLSRGASRWQLQTTATFFQMPRACLVESHAGSYCSGKRETPRDKLVASQKQLLPVVAATVKLHDARSWHLRQSCLVRSGFKGTNIRRALSPALVAEYQTKLPDKKLLRAKLHEFYALSQAAAALKAEADALPLPKKAKRKRKGGAP